MPEVPAVTDGIVIRLATPPPPVVNEPLVRMLRSILASAERGETVAMAGVILCSDRSTGRALAWPDMPINLLAMLGEFRLAERRLCEVIEQRE